MDTGNQVFAYYKYGVHRADVIMERAGVLHRKKDIGTGAWSDFRPVGEKDNAFYELPLAEIAQNLEELNSAFREGAAEVTLGYGAHYHRYQRVAGSVAGKRDTAWIWVQRGVKFPLDVVACRDEVIGFIKTRREGCLILVRPGYEDLTPLGEWHRPGLSQAVHTVKHMGTFQVEMRDGVKLATEVYLPGDLLPGTKVPTILIRTPYGRTKFAEPELRFVFRGYAVVAQDCRGRGDSEGEWLPFVHELADGSDTLDWIAAQPWSDGKVGMIGGSYGGFVQWAAAGSGNPHLKAMVSLVTSGSPFGDLPRKGGTLMSGVLAWCFMVAEKHADPAAVKRDDWDKVLSYRPIKDIPFKALGKEIPFWSEWMRHPDYDRFWQAGDWRCHGDKINVPALIISGWYDDDGQGTSEAWDMVNKYRRGNQRLILGPWYHQANTTRDIHNIAFGDNAIRYDLDVLYLRWFDRFLKGIENEVEKEPRVQYYLVGADEWRNADAWPPAEVKLTKLYLRAGGKLSFTAPPTQERPDTYTFDPSDPAPHLIDVSENELSVPENYKEVEKRADVLTYTTEPLAEDVTVAGDLFACLYAASSARDTDWVIRVTDVDDQGNSIRVSDGILRARYRHGFDCPKLLTPGQVEEYRLRLTRVGYVFKEGHRIRVQVTSGAQNLAFPNTNTGDDPAADAESVVANQTVLHEPDYPSHVELPLLS
ncbi:MAG TPA: CocE/NonD family hydrolase [Firmicutes bacterium]|nr:CocE/NonD family hydrolase [Bacillota bacterium]